MNPWTKYQASTVSGLEFNEDNSCIVTGSFDGTIKFWRTYDGLLLESIAVGDQGSSYVTGLARAGITMAVALSNGVVKVFRDAVLMNEFPAFTASCVGIAISPDGSMIAVGGGDKIDSLNQTFFLRVFRVLDGAQMFASCFGTSNKVSAMAFSPSGDRLFYGDQSVGGSVLYSRRTSDFSMAWPPFIAHSNSILSVRCSPDGATLASGGCDFELKFWSANTGSPVKSIGPFGDAVNSIDWLFDSSGVILSTWAKEVEIVKLDGTKPFSIMDFTMPIVVRMQPGRLDRYAAGRGQDYSVSYCDLSPIPAPNPTMPPPSPSKPKGGHK